MENRLVTIEDTALGDRGVAFALAHNLTFPRDRINLEAVGALELGIISFQYLIVVSILFYTTPFCLVFF